MFHSIGSYYPTSSVIHKRNSIVKVLSCLIFLILCAFINSKEACVVAAIFTLILVLMSYIPLSLFIKSLKSLSLFLIFIIIIDLCLHVPLAVISIMIVKIVLIVIYSYYLILTTKVFDLTRGLAFVLAPLKIFKVQVNKVALSLTLALRFIPSIIDEANNILFAYKTRGIDYSSANIKNKIKILSNILIPMFVLAIRRADNLAMVMSARMYDVNATRTSLCKNKINFGDVVYLSVHLILMVAIIYRRYI